MRVTNSILQQRALAGIQQNLRALDDARARVSSRLRIERPSDDPLGTEGILRASSSLRSLTQYQKNVSIAGSRLGIEESVLNQVGDALVRAKELGLSGMGETATDETRAAAREELEQIADFVQELGNTRFGDGYLFGGAYADSRPFPDSGIDPARPPSGDHAVEASEGRTLLTNHAGQEVFVDSGVLDSLDQLETALQAGDDVQIGAALSDIDAAFEEVQGLLGETGARMRQVELTEQNLSTLELNVTQLRSDLQDADFEKAVTELVAQQTAYQAALAANSRILSLSLTEYL